MAQVFLSRRDCVEGALPPLCLVCGEPTTHCVEKDFAGSLLWAAPATFVLSAFGGDAPGGRVRVPLCPDHLDDWRRRRWGLLAFAGVAISLLAVAGVGCWMLVDPAGQARPAPVPSEFVGMTLLSAGLLWSAVTFVGFLHYAWLGIRATEIHETGVRLVNVSVKFVRAYESSLFLGGIDVASALDPYHRPRARRGRNITEDG